MASDINRVILIGRAVRDPELKSTNSGSYYCRFTLASNKSIYNRQTGETRDEAGFFDCVVWGKAAENLTKLLKKGKRCCVEGSLKWSSWEGADGKKQSKTEISVETFQVIDYASGGNDGGRVEPDGAAAAAFDGQDGDIPY